MAWYTRQEIKEIEGESRAELGRLFCRYVKMSQCEKALERLTSEDVLFPEEFEEAIAKESGLSGGGDLREYRWFNPQLADYLKDGRRLAIASEEGWEVKREIDDEAKFRLLGLNPHEIKEMVRKANRCEILYNSYNRVNSQREQTNEISLVDIDSPLFPQLISTKDFGGFYGWDFNLGPTIWVPWDKFLAEPKDKRKIEKLS